jgi:N utilization substance protein A
MEVPEIYDGIVNIIHATRESGKRAKISVVSTDDDIDPVGACVGIRGSRVQTIVNELNGERVDIVRWAEDIETYARNALAPAEIESMTINEEKREIKVQVELGQLSLAIGRQGVNVRLASKLTGYKIDVGSSEPDRLSIEEQLDIGLEKIRLQREQEAAEEAGVAEVETTTEAEAAETPEAADAGATTEANTTAEDEAPETEAVETPEAETSEEVATTEANTTAEDEAPETETAEIPEASAENNAVPAVEYALTPEQEPMAEDADEDATQADAPEQTPSA